MFGRKQSVSEGTSGTSSQNLYWLGLELEKKWTSSLEKAMTVIAYELEYTEYEIAELRKQLDFLQGMVGELIKKDSEEPDISPSGESDEDIVTIAPLPKKKDCEKEIIKLKLRNPEATTRQIADAVGCSVQYVRRILKRNRRKFSNKNRH